MAANTGTAQMDIWCIVSPIIPTLDKKYGTQLENTRKSEFSFTFGIPIPLV
jgi:hypothetical protein